MNQTSMFDVLIVGAGPTGLTLAYQLRRLGVSFRIVDKNPAPSSTSKAIGLQYRVSEVLTWMGLFERFLAQGVTGAGVNFYAGGERMFQLKFDRFDGMSGHGAFEPQSIVIPQSVTEGLLEALGRLGVEYSWVLPGSAQQLCDSEGLIDVTGDFQRLYGAGGELLYLIRPDGYVGLFQRPVDEPALRAYLARLFTIDSVERAFAGTRCEYRLRPDDNRCTTYN